MKSKGSSETSVGKPSDESDETVASVVRELAAEARARQDWHPDPETLIAYSLGELGQSAADGVRAHLEICPDCSRAVLDLVDLARFETSPDEPSPEEVTIRLRELEKKLPEHLSSMQRAKGQTDVAKPSAVPLFRNRIHQNRWTLPAVWAATLLAAVLLPMVVNRGANEPWPNVHVVSLAPSDQSLIRDAEGRPTQLRVPPENERFVVILNLSNSQSFPRYLLTLYISTELGGKDTEVWRYDGLRRAETGNFTVEFDRSFLAPGRYIFEISGIDGNDKVELARYAVDLVYD